MQAAKTISVTGGNGYIGLQIVENLLKQNFKVVATVRDANNSEKTKDLKGLSNQENLKIVSADFSNPATFEEAFKGVDAVIHNASPFTSGNSKERESYVKPAIEGVEGVFQAILKNSSTIRNVVQISSMAAVCGAPGSKPDDYVFSNKDWSDSDNQEERKAYYALSKTLAEKRTWEFKDELSKNNIKLVTICPTLVLGPIISTSNQSLSTTMLQAYLDGSKTEIPQYSVSLVDVRDVADMCINAVTKNSEGRFISVQGGHTVESIVEILRKYASEEVKAKIPSKVAEGKKAVPSSFDLKESRVLLGRDFISGEQCVKEMLESWVRNKQI